jgi:predicted TIM-barrel fold metal-dependent hydrolase
MRPYIDAHVHIGWTITRDPIVGQTTGRYMARMATSGIVAAIAGPTAVGSSLARGILDIQAQNEVISRACRQFPERFPIGLALVELRVGDAGVEEVARALTTGGLKGLMYHPSGGGMPLARLYPYLEVAAMAGGLCLLHGRAGETAELARRFPEATFVVHAGQDDITETCAPLDNVWFEVVQRPHGAGSERDWARLVDQLGVERIVFGGDTPYYDYRVTQISLEAAQIGEDTKDRIAYRNAVTLIRTFRPDWSLPQGPVLAPQQYPTEELWAARGERLL